jgi:alkanesulfonate monooxygenase SsuD/methylene tetrahydromethanopterin reductase-like flavin-dependent oxidoreductase (luciferase family)
MYLPDCWVTLAAIAGVTQNLRLLTVVTNVYYRHPAWQARLAADVDRLSNGRLVLGLGLGDNELEFQQLGIPFPAVRDRQQALEEAIQAINGLLAGQALTVHGQYFQFAEARVEPGPVQRPRVPLLIGGGGERMTLRLVAQYADACNFGPHEWTGAAYTLDDVKRKLDALRRHCEVVGRNYDSILRTYWVPFYLSETEEGAQRIRTREGIAWRRRRVMPFFGTPEQAIDYLQQLVELGMQYFTVVVDGRDVDALHLLGEQVIPALRPVHVLAS